MKTWLVIKREYWTRVRKKSFIIVTLLVPLLIVGFYGLIIALSIMDTGSKKIGVIDESGFVSTSLQSSENLKYINILDADLESAKKIDSLDGVLYIKPFDLKNDVTFNIFSQDQIGVGPLSKVENDINDIIVDKRISEAGVNIKVIDELRKSTAKVVSIDKDGKESANTIAAVLGYASGMLLYFFLFFYGYNVMKSVTEEKTNRIAEIIVSSIKPFQLMLGKIIGVAMVGLTQFLLWVILLGIIGTVGMPLLMSSSLMADPALASQMSTEVMQSSMSSSSMMNPDNLKEVMRTINSINWTTILSWFLFYFLGGYFLYASMFAAVGSLVDEDAQESQQLTFPITMPIILGFVMLMSTVKDPNSTMAIVGSIIPFTSPIVMMGRITYGIGAEMYWQLALSVVLLIGTFILMTKLAAKIYRTGILMYGKKVTLKDLGKMIFRKS